MTAQHLGRGWRALDPGPVLAGPGSVPRRLSPPAGKAVPLVWLRFTPAVARSRAFLGRARAVSSLLIVSPMTMPSPAPDARAARSHSRGHSPCN
ncbi:hypothetical protein [Aeromonas bivalvium]|uniref:hypothetical protein n=1 Tax=Aeromonas bivalvium TaxID=440079 RepID=UPI0038D01C80